MNFFLMCISCGECFLLSFILFSHPLRQNQAANRWLACFIFIMGTAFLGISLSNRIEIYHLRVFIGWMNSLQFLLSPFLFLSILFFVEPVKVFSKRDILHFIPFIAFVSLQAFVLSAKRDLMTVTLFEAGNFVFFIRDLLPFQFIGYIIVSYFLLIRHKINLKWIIASDKGITLDWLRHFLVILAVLVVFWINDGIFGEPTLLTAMPIIYTASVFFLSYYAIRQGTVFVFEKKDLEAVSQIMETPIKQQAPKVSRLSMEQLNAYAQKLDHLMIEEKLYLDNKLNLTMLADRIGASVHDTSFLVNTLKGENFYAFINQWRVEEAKRLLRTGKMDKLNMNGIAFGSGFNSKTAFNMAFKKYAGCSPSGYIKQLKLE